MRQATRGWRVWAGLALLWNLLGCAAFISDLRLTAADIAALPAAQQALYAARPAWAVAATATAVFGGAAGCAGLLLARRWAVPLLALSLLGIVAQDIGLFVLAGGAAVAAPAVWALQGLVLLVGIALLVLARRAAARGVLR
jgi:hypothetical protein